ncbi:MAG: hypothetical protein ACTSYD_00325 [Candidatus Heimdallarchaeaceae archaeon]
MNSQTDKSKKGQVFLLLAMVILIYLIFLSSTVYRISQSPFIEPAPNQEKLVNYIDNTMSNIYELADVGLSQYSLGASETTVTNVIINGLNAIETYLFQHSLPSNIELQDGSLDIYNSSSLNNNPVSIHIDFKVNILIDSPELHYSSEFTVNVTYFLEISGTTGTDNYIFITKSQAGIESVIANAIISISSPATVINWGDGSYQVDLEPGDVITAQLPHNIFLWKIA